MNTTTLKILIANIIMLAVRVCAILIVLFILGVLLYTIVGAWKTGVFLHFVIFMTLFIGSAVGLAVLVYWASNTLENTRCNQKRNTKS